MPTKRPSTNTESPRANLTIPELELAKVAALGTLISSHSRWAYKNAIEKFIARYCSEPRHGFRPCYCVAISSFSNHSHYQLRRLIFVSQLSAVYPMIAAEISTLSPELAIGIRRVMGVKLLGKALLKLLRHEARYSGRPGETGQNWVVESLRMLFGQ